MRLSEELQFVQLFEPKDLAAGAYVSDAVDLGKFNSFTAFITFGAITGNSVLTVNADTTSALATALTTPIAFKYRQTAADFKVALSDQLGDPIAVALTGLTLTAATFDHTTLVIEIDPDTLGSTAHWVTFNLSAVANPCLVSGIGIGRSRYAGHLIPSAI
jgi:hypothetical protein